MQSSEQNRLRSLARFAGRGRILDVGFQNCPNPFLEGEVVGLDIDVDETPETYYDIVQANVVALPFQHAVFDAIVAGELIEHLENVIAFLLECNRVLKSEGKLIVSTPNPYYLPTALKGLLLLDRYLITNTHVQTLDFRLVKKLGILCGYELNGICGDLFRVPKIGLLIPMRRLPSISRNILYCLRKIEDVSRKEFDVRMELIARQERERARTAPD